MIANRGIRFVRAFSISGRSGISQARTVSHQFLPNIAISARAPTAIRQRPDQALGIRWASSSPGISSGSTATSPQLIPSVAGDASKFPNIDTITLTDVDLSQIPQDVSQVGDLAKLGIDYGYGPTSLLQWIMENFHVTAGLPWWASIAATAAVVRLLLFPLFLKSADSTARATALASITGPIQKRMTECQQAKDQQGTTIAFQELLTVRRQAGIRFRDQFAPLIFQGVFGFCGFRLINALANRPVPGFSTGGFSWLSDLTVSDPYLILPVLMGVSMHIVGRIGGESGAGVSAGSAPGTPAQMRTLLLYVMPIAITVIMGWQPAGLAVWFATSGFLGLSQAFILRNESARQFLRIAPIYKPTAQEATESNPLNALVKSMSGSKLATTSRQYRETPRSVPRIEYQAPNLTRTSADGSVLPKPATNAREHDRPADGLLKGLKQRWDTAKESQREQTEMKAFEKAKAARLRAAEAYEERAKTMGR